MDGTSMGEMTSAHRINLLRAGRRRWLLRRTEEAFAEPLGADRYDEVDVLHRDVIAVSAHGVEVML